MSQDRRRDRAALPASTVQCIGGEFVVSAELVAFGLALSVGDLRMMMGKGVVICRHEEGIDKDAGRHRLTFLTDHRSFRLTVTAEGQILQRSSIDYGPIKRPGPRPAH
jgi:hypothetical protein